MQSLDDDYVSISARELQALQARLADAEDKLDALYRGAVDALVVKGPHGPKIYSLQDADHPYRVLVEQMHEAALTLNKDGAILYCNARFRSLMQGSSKPLLGTPFGDLVVADERQLLHNLIDAATIEPLRTECHLAVNEETSIPVQVSLSSLLTESFHGLCVIVTDLRDHYANQIIASSERVHRTILDQASDAILACDFFGRIRRANQSAIGLFGETVLGISVNALWQGQLDFSGAAAPLENLRSVPIEYTSMAGERLSLLVSAKLLDGDAADNMGWIITVTDITLIKRAEQQLRDADRRKDEFLAMLAHELRNPLAPIKSTLEVMRLTGSPDATFVWGRTLINRQVEHMTRLVDDLLDVSRLTQGKIVLQKKLVSLDEVVERALEASRPLIDSHKHRLTISLPTEAVYFDADPVRLAQVVLNLLNNAAKYTQEGGLIDVSAISLDGELLLRVKDNGRGIPPEVLPRVFDLFIQGDQSLAHSQGGLGIGLTLVRNLVQMHGGSVSVESEGLGQGSEFIVRLPLVHGVLAGAIPPRAIQPVAKAAGYRILLIDDNVDAVESLGLLLQMSGHEIRKALDGHTAIKVAEEFQPQIVLCDIGLPGTDGYEVIRRLREQTRGTMPVMAAVTGYGKTEDIKRTKEAGFDYHFVKPIDIEDLQKLMADQEQRLIH